MGNKLIVLCVKDEGQNNSGLNSALNYTNALAGPRVEPQDSDAKGKKNANRDHANTKPTGSYTNANMPGV